MSNELEHKGIYYGMTYHWYIHVHVYTHTVVPRLSEARLSEPFRGHNFVINITIIYKNWWLSCSFVAALTSCYMYLLLFSVEECFLFNNSIAIVKTTEKLSSTIRCYSMSLFSFIWTILIIWTPMSYRLWSEGWDNQGSTVHRGHHFSVRLAQTHPK